LTTPGHHPFESRSSFAAADDNGQPIMAAADLCQPKAGTVGVTESVGLMVSLPAKVRPIVSDAPWFRARVGNHTFIPSRDCGTMQNRIGKGFRIG
jgi:hypothetical protein